MKKVFTASVDHGIMFTSNREKAVLEMGKMILAVAVAVIFLAWGQMSDVSDELTAQQDRYCTMVADGNWPDYKNTYEMSCK